MTFQPTFAAWERLLTLPGLWSSLGNSVAISVGAATLLPAGSMRRRSSGDIGPNATFYLLRISARDRRCVRLLCLAFIWNEWIYASALGYIEARSFPVLIQATGSGGGVNFGAATTRALAATAVPVVAALLAQRYMVRALSIGSGQGLIAVCCFPERRAACNLQRDAGMANASVIKRTAVCGRVLIGM